MPFIKFLILSIALIAVGFFTFNINQNKDQEDGLFQKAQQIIDICKDRFDWRGCYGNQLGQYNKEGIIKDTLLALKVLQDLDSKTRDCHLISHYIAQSEVEKDPSKWLDIFNFVDQTTCVNGFVHGVLEGRSRFDSGFELEASAIPQICANIEARTTKRTGIEAKSQVDDACAHILGHILLSQVGGNIDEAVSTCEQLSADYKMSCMQGIFMENITRENLVVHEVAPPLPKTLDSAIEVNLICKKQTDNEARGACFRELSHLYTLITRHDPLNVYSLCHQALTEEEGRECYLHAINLMILNDNFGEEKLSKLCINYINIEAFYKSCISRAISPLLSSSIKFTDRAITFCNNLSESSKEFCFRKIGEKLRRLAPANERIKLCSSAPQTFAKVCSGS